MPTRSLCKEVVSSSLSIRTGLDDSLIVKYLIVTLLLQFISVSGVAGSSTVYGIGTPTSDQRTTVISQEQRNPTTMQEVLPMFIFSRTYGPLWGGTRISITPQRQPTTPGLNITSVNFDELFFSTIRPTYSNIIYTDHYEWFIQSPPGQQLGRVDVYVTYGWPESNTYISLSEKHYFDYREDPVVTNLYPTNHFTSGGTRLTVNGTNLDVPGRAAVQLRIITHYLHTGEVKETYSITSDCYGYDATDRVLICRMPKVELIESIEKKLSDDYKNLTKTSTRRKRAASNIATLSSEDGSEFAQLFLDLILEGQSVGTGSTEEFKIVPTDAAFINSTTDVIKILNGEGKTLHITVCKKGLLVNVHALQRDYICLYSICKAGK